MLGVFSRIDNWKRDLTINHARLSEDAGDEQLRPPLITGTPAEVAERIATWVDQQGRWKIISQQDVEQGVEMKLTRTTPIMRFTDDIDVVLRARVMPLVCGLRVNRESAKGIWDKIPAT